MSCFTDCRGSICGCWSLHLGAEPAKAQESGTSLGRQAGAGKGCSVCVGGCAQSQALVALTRTRFEGSYCFTALKPLLCTSSLAQRQQKQQARDCERVIWVLTKSNRAEGRTTEDEGEIPKLVFLLPSLIWLFHQQPSIPFLLYSLFSTQTPNSPFPPHLQIPLLYPITLQLPLTHP